MKNAPVPLYDGNGGYNTYIKDKVIPDLLSVIERSGLSFEDAKLIPAALSNAIDESILKMMSGTVFTGGSLNGL